MILLIGGAAILVWVIHNRSKKASATKTMNQPVVTPPESVKSQVVPRQDIQRGYNIVMPSDIISPSVRQKADMLTARRYSIDKSKLV